MLRTWLANSLVGEMITALNPRLAGCCRWASSGRQNAKVFPDPVGAQASSSRPWSKDTEKLIKPSPVTPCTHHRIRPPLHSRASWAGSPASALALESSAQSLWGSGGYGGWDDTRTAAPRTCKRGQAHRSHARLYDVESEYDSPKIKSSQVSGACTEP